ncbi:MAG: response regulator [Deltaproteobacteria bacterium]|nr:response regulator [Deltaproteobacteria bacterium]
MEMRADAGGASGRESEAALHKESAAFLSTHLLRELVVADARDHGPADEPAVRAEALLAAVLAGLDLTEGAIVRADPSGGGTCLAVRGIPDHARQLLEARGAQIEQLGPSLLQRALAAHRVLLLDRTTREPLMPALRDGNPGIESAVIVPLADLGVPVGVLLLAARGRKLSAPFLRSLAVAFRLLGILLAPGRGAAARPPEFAEETPPAADGERYLFEIEELTARLSEVRESAQRTEERASSAETALRAELESARARVAGLEAQLASAAAPARARELELETLCGDQARAIAEHERRAAALEREVALLLEGAAHRDAGDVIELDVSDSWPEAALQDASPADALREPGDADGREATIELEETDDEQLGAIAEAAAAAIAEDAASRDAAAGALRSDAETEDPSGAGGDPSREPLSLLEAAAQAADQVRDEPTEDQVAAGEELAAHAPWAVLHVDGREGARVLARTAAEEGGAVYWCGEGDLPVADRALVVVNLLDDALPRVASSRSGLWDASRWIVYGATDGNAGFELPSCGLVRRPIDPRGCIEQLHLAAGCKPSGMLLVSAQLREVVPLRQALQEVDVAGSVACDVRQALDLLEIVRRPEVILIDLALPQGQGLGLAAQLRRQPETASLPLLLLLPPEPDPVRLLREAEKARMLVPFGDADAHRLVRTVLAGRA